MMIRNFALAMALLWPTVAAANRIEEFWDGLRTEPRMDTSILNDGDGNEDVLLCRTEESVAHRAGQQGIPPANPVAVSPATMRTLQGSEKRKALWPNTWFRKSQ